MSTDWSIKYRPKTLSEVVGQKINIELLQDRLSNPYQTMIFYGSSGCGKTTTARALANDLGAEVIELDAAANNSVDDAREILDYVARKSFTGVYKFVILDECFSADTLIDTDKGKIKISDVQVGQYVKNLYGKGKVQAKSEKKISLDSLAIVNTSCYNICTTKNHLFFTQRGWVEAGSLTQKDILYVQKDLPDLRKRVSDKELLREDLLFELWSYLSGRNTEKEAVEALCYLREGVFCSPVRQEENLFEGVQVCSYWEKEGGSSSDGVLQRKYAEEQPYVERGSSSKNAQNKGNEWNSPCLERKKGWKWNLVRAAKSFIKRVGGGVDSGISCDSSLDKSVQENKSFIAHLQGRYWKSDVKSSDRSGWESSLIQICSAIGLEADRKVKRSRVESVSFYQRGNNEELFRSCYKDKDFDKGFVTLYDLQVSNHPSYFADGVLVHNCHLLSKQAWNALLKTIEEPPKRVVFLFCTTEYKALPQTILGRSQLFKFYPLTEEELIILYNRVKESEKFSFNDNLVHQIIRKTKNQARDFLKLLQKAVDAEVKTVEELEKLTSTPPIAMAGAYLQGVLQGDAKLAVSALKKIKTPLMEWKDRLISLIYEIQEDRFGISELKYSFTQSTKIRNLGEKYSTKQFGHILTYLISIKREEEAYALLFTLALRGTD